MAIYLIILCIWGAGLLIHCVEGLGLYSSAFLDRFPEVYNSIYWSNRGAYLTEAQYFMGKHICYV